MAATATQQVLTNGLRNLIVHYTIGGTTGDADGVTLVDVSSLVPDLNPTGLALAAAEWSLSGFALKISWDADTDVDIVEFCEGDGQHNWRSKGYIQNNAGTGITGDINFSTNGYTAAGDVGHFTLWFKKRR